MKQMITLIPYARVSFGASVLVFFAAIAGFLLVGSIYSDTQARGLIEALNPAIQTLCFAVITSASTIIPLLLAILGIANRVDNEFNPVFYARIKIIATLGTLALISAALLLLFITIPITESDALRTWYNIAYYFIIVGSSWITALLVSIVITLYKTLSGLIEFLTPEFDV